MSYDEYIRSSTPVRVSAILFAVFLLLPIAIIVFEGWHSGVPYGFATVVSAGILIPGIYLLRPLALGLWMAFSGIVSLLCLLTIEHYWRSVPDWADAKIPHGVTSAISTSLFCVQASMIILGTCGWVRYTRIRNAGHANT